MSRKLYSVVAILVIASFILAACGSSDGGSDASSGGNEIFDRVIERGNLVCGVRTDLTGFGYLDDAGRKISDPIMDEHT